MIKLADGAVFVRDESGNRVPLDLERLQDDLYFSVRDAGVKDQDLPGDLLDVVLSYIGRSGDDPPSPAELDRLVVRLLGDCGMHAVARVFGDRRHLGASAQLGEHVVVSPAAVAAVIATDPFFPLPPGQALAERVAAHLAAMSLPEAGRALVRELARNLWLRDRQATRSSTPATAAENPAANADAEAAAAASAGAARRRKGGRKRPAAQLHAPSAGQGADPGADLVDLPGDASAGTAPHAPPAAPPDSSDGYWLIRREDLPAYLAAHLAAPFAAGLVRARGISRLLPAVDLELDLRRLLDRTPGAVEVPELLYLPAFAELCAQLAEIANALHAELRRCLPEADSDGLHTRISLVGLESICSRLGGGPGSQALALRHDLLAITRRQWTGLPRVQIRHA